MNPTELINNLLKRSDGSLDQLKLHYGPLIRKQAPFPTPLARNNGYVRNGALKKSYPPAMPIL